ncbi:MAG: cytochrome c maturation protein CcmE [Pseudomonadaceae bacterium]|nr:cytochrome c maturation protein CcmE [Pseudomonadaceae bacterium]
MNPKRRARLQAVTFILLGAALTVGLVLFAVRENINMFYEPARIASGEAPTDTRIRAGGMVLDGSVERSDESLAVSFVLTDHAGSDFTVYYSGILPDLFREGQGILVQGQLDSNRHFQAEEVLAKHDENYMPPELAGMAMQGDGSADTGADLP